MAEIYKLKLPTVSEHERSIRHFDLLELAMTSLSFEVTVSPVQEAQVIELKRPQVSSDEA